MTATTSFLEVRRLGKSYDGRSYALRNCSLSLAEGRTLAIVGPSGSGKSTLLRLVAGLEDPTEGDVCLAGKVISDERSVLPPRHRRCGMVFQDFALFPHLTATENVAFGLPKADRPGRVPELLELVGLEGKGQRYPHELSGGERQRLALARTLAPSPRLLLLDEPFSSLDADLRGRIRGKVQDITRRLGLTTLLITHDISDAIAVADEIVFLRGGSLEARCPTEELFRTAVPERLRFTLAEMEREARRVTELRGR